MGRKAAPRANFLVVCCNKPEPNRALHYTHNYLTHSTIIFLLEAKRARAARHGIRKRCALGTRRRPVGRRIKRCSWQRPTQPPTGGGLSWWLLPLRGGHGRGLRRVAAVMAEVFAPSWWSRRRSFLHRQKNNAKNRFTSDFCLFITGTCLGFAPLRGTCAVRRNFRRNRRGKGGGSRKKPPPLAVGGSLRNKKGRAFRGGRIARECRWGWGSRVGGHVACGGLRRAALEVTAVFCGHGRCFFLEVFLGFVSWRLKRHNP